MHFLRFKLVFGIQNGYFRLKMFIFEMEKLVFDRKLQIFTCRISEAYVNGGLTSAFL